MLNWLFGKKAKKDDGRNGAAECELPTDVTEMEPDLQAARDRADRADSKFEHNTNEHRNATIGAGSTFDGLKEDPAFQAMKEKWKRQNLADA